MELHLFRIRYPAIEVELTTITSFIWYSWFTVIDTFVYTVLYCQMPWITFHSDYTHPMFPYQVRMSFYCIFIYAMALCHVKSGVCLV